MFVGDFGGREGIRTLGLLVANEALSQLSYSPTSSDLGNFTMSRKEDSNRVPNYYVREVDNSRDCTLRSDGPG